MSTHLDLDDAAAPHPLAVAELAELRAENARLRSAITRACASYPAGDDCVPTCVAVLRTALAPDVELSGHQRPAQE